MNTLTQLPPIGQGLNLIIGLLVKVLMVMLTLLSLILLRQDQLMSKVLDIPFGSGFKMIVWSFLVLTLVLTAIVIVLV